MVAAMIGIYGNTKEEAIYPAYFVDENKQKRGGSNRYTLRFAKGQLPPLNSFWPVVARDEGAFLLGPAALLAESGGVGRQVECPAIQESEVRRRPVFSSHGNNLDDASILNPPVDFSFSLFT